MAKSETSNPCADEEREYRNSLKAVEAADKALANAWRALNRDPYTKSISKTDEFIAIKDALDKGEWPSDQLSEFADAHDTTLGNYAKAVYKARKKLDELKKKAEKAKAAWNERKRKHKRGGSGGSFGGGSSGGGGGNSGSWGRCGKPCVGHGSKGKRCQVRLGEDGECQYHG